MIVSTTTFYVILAILVVILLIPAWMKSGKSKKSYWHFLAVLAFPVYMFVPSFYTVTSCGEYTEEKVLFPKGGMTWGRNFYLLNNSDSQLLLEYIPYGEVSNVPNDVVIQPNSLHHAERSELNYPFEKAPTSVKVKKAKGTVKTRLECYKGKE